MNMMSKIYASTAMNPVELEEQDTTPRTITLPLVTPEVSPALAAMIEAYADAVNSHNAREDDEEFDDGGLMEQIIAWPAASYADLAAKTALSMYELRGRARLTAGAVYLPVDFQAALHAEDLMIAASHDARRLASHAPSLSSATEWDKALAAYRAARASSEAMPLGTAGEDEAVDTYCELMDHLIENVPAPDGDALATKLMLAFSRCEGGSFFDQYKDPIIADARRLGLSDQRVARTPTASSEATDGRWDTKLAAYIAAKAKYDASPTPREDDDPDMLAMMAAEDELIRVPAPDLTALRTKIDLEFFRDCVPGGSEWKAIKADIERLSAGGGAPRPQRLSPAMTKAVVNWKALAAAYNAACETPDVDEETTIQLCHLSTDAAKALGATPSKTMEDFALKVYLLALVECDQNGPSPLNFEPGDDDFEETALWRGIIADLPQVSSSVRALMSSD